MRKGWEIKRLNDVCEVEYGTRVVNKRDGGKIHPVYGGGGATFFMDVYNREDCLVVARFAMSEQCARFVHGKFFLNDSGLTVKPKDKGELIQEFLDLQILFLNDHIYSLARGTAQKNLDVPAFRNIIIQYPKSLSEQHRIVAILDEAFVAIAKAKVNAEKNLANSREVFESTLQCVFANRGVGWEEKALQDIVDSNCTLSYGIVQPGDDFPKGLPVVRPTDLSTKIINLTGLKLIDPQLANSYKRTTLLGNELLLCVRGNTGVISISANELIGANVTRGIVPIRFDSNILKLQFCYYQFISEYVHKQIKEKTYGTACNYSPPTNVGH
jgi:type I restriction enzyme S subunit